MTAQIESSIDNFTYIENYGPIGSLPMAHLPRPENGTMRYPAKASSFTVSIAT